jgi:WhiB family redox-sensing transcriptional regulator
MTATITEAPAYPCRCGTACGHTMATPAGSGGGWSQACRRRWERAGKPASGPPAADSHRPRQIRGSNESVARKMAEFAALRAQGATVLEAAAEMGITDGAAGHYSVKLREQVREEVMEAPIDWPVPASPLPGVSCWTGKAACRGHQDLFYAPDGPETQRAKEIRDAKAKSLCAACPVRAACRAEAAAGAGKSGTWAGVSEDDRERNKKRRAAGVRAERDRRNAAARAAARQEQDGVAA